MPSTNTVDITTKTSNVTIKDIKYIKDTLAAPAGSSAPTFMRKSDKAWVITLKADRNGSKAFADTFNTRAGGAYHEYAPDDGGPGKQPEKLNFCFAVAITFSYKDGSATKTAVAPVVWLGQGHYTGTNNWWIGGAAAVANTDNKDPILLASSDATTIVLGISGGTSRFDFTYESKSSDFDLTNWMKRVADDTLLSGMTIPGTHDSAALYGGDLAITQTRKLIDQLNGGVRFLDIRCRHIENVFTIHHGPVYEKINFGNGVLKVCLDFLAQHPTETIVMSVKEEYNPSGNTRTFQETFDNYVKVFNSRSKWYFGDTVPTLKAVRGKIVLFRRFETDRPGTVLGLKALPFAPPDATFTISNTTDFSIQDEYKVPTLFNRGAKWNAVLKQLKAAKSTKPKSLFVNFCSGTSTGAYPYSVANYVNPRLIEYFSENIKGRFGCVLVDFETPGLNRLIAETNL